jgi:hypothetical protein
MNGGDCFHDQDVLKQVSAHLTADIIEGQAIRQDDHRPLRHHDPDLFHQLLSDGISHQSSFIRRELLVRYPYDERYQIVADWKFWLLTLMRDRCSYQYVDSPVADIDMTGITYSKFSQNLQERDTILAELRDDPVMAPWAQVIRDYNYLTHNTLVQYATYLDRHSPRAYQLARKITKRIIKFVK